MLLGILVLVLLSYSWMFGGVTVPNERTRVYLAVALVDDGSLSIDGPIKRFGRTVDEARFEGRYYTDKAPGSSLLGAGLYGLVRIFSKPEDWEIRELTNLMRTWLMIPIGIFGFFLLRRFLGRFGTSSEMVDIVSLGWILGSPAFHYSTAFYGHQIVAVSLLAALVLLEEGRKAEVGAWAARARFAGAGLAAGLAGLTEYQSAIPCVLLAGYVLVIGLRTPSRIAAFVAGAAPFLAALVAYNWIAFGGPFELSYHHLVLKSMQVQHHYGVGGVTYPKAEAVFGVLFSLHRGLVTTSPLFVLAPIGLFFMWRDKNRLLAMLVGVTFFGYLLFIMSAHVWHGGWGFGLRLLVPVMAWAAIPSALAADRLDRDTIAGGVVRGLVVLGCIHNQLVHLVFPEMPDACVNPLAGAVLPAMKIGLLSPNLVTYVTERPGLYSIVPALLLILITSCFVLVRGLRRKKRKFRMVLSVVSSAVVLGIFVLAVAAKGPGWNKRKTKRFFKHMMTYQKAEYPVVESPGSTAETKK